MHVVGVALMVGDHVQGPNGVFNVRGFRCQLPIAIEPVHQPIGEFVAGEWIGQAVAVFDDMGEGGLARGRRIEERGFLFGQPDQRIDVFLEQHPEQLVEPTLRAAFAHQRDQIDPFQLRQFQELVDLGDRDVALVLIGIVEMR